ncbi:MAG: helix-turn-helix transcriptional regulator [Trueperaceae bacterium]
MAGTEESPSEQRQLEFRKALGARVRELRRQRGINQDDFAYRAGIHRTHVGMLENGKIDPKISTVLRVADALGLEFWELVRLDK